MGSGSKDRELKVVQWMGQEAQGIKQKAEQQFKVR